MRDALLEREVIYILGKCTNQTISSLLFKDRFCIQSRTFFSKIFFFESAPCKWKLFCIQSELIIVSKLCKTSYNLNWTLLLNSILYALLMHDLGLRKVQVQFFCSTCLGNYTWRKCSSSNFRTSFLYQNELFSPSTRIYSWW